MTFQRRKKSHNKTIKKGLSINQTMDQNENIFVSRKSCLSYDSFHHFTEFDVIKLSQFADKSIGTRNTFFMCIYLCKEKEWSERMTWHFHLKRKYLKQILKMAIYQKCQTALKISDAFYVFHAHFAPFCSYIYFLQWHHNKWKVK